MSTSLNNQTKEIEATQSPVVNTNVRDESFYLERFKRIVKDRYATHGRFNDQDFYCEIYKGFAIVCWQQVWNTPTGNTPRVVLNNYVWEVGGLFDHLENLAWVSQGCVTTGYGSKNFTDSIKKVKKKIDVLSDLYSIKSELFVLSRTSRSRGIASTESPVFNASVGDVVAIHAFGRTRLGKIVRTTGNRFIVGYMTPSNPHDVHYKTLRLNDIYPRERQQVNP